ncbi:MAG: ribosome assembly cofactor RimP [Bacteroidales bacterium]|nr:ribosome assembly cofactor RimP [Bacteroidales bacterium]
MDIKEVKEFVEGQLKDTDYFLVDLTITASNEIKVEVDSPQGVDIDYCVELSRAIEEAFSRDEEDYELEVGSAGLSSPFKVIGQYEKHLGDRVDVLTADGRKLLGTLTEVNPENFTITVQSKVKPEGAKRPVLVDENITFAYGDVKSVKYHFDF